MTNQTLGIDHPVVAVRDHASVLERYRAIGFSPSPVSYHPWGTVLSLMMFRDNFIEIIGVHDASKFGTGAVNDFCYGRNVGAFLERAEGLALVALHSKDADADHSRLTNRGLKSQGRVDFRRSMTKADGSTDVAVVSLGLFLNDEHPDVSHFICHQHRPELIWVPEWQDHENGVNAITAVTYVAEEPRDLLARFEALYGRERVQYGKSTVTVDTGYGVFQVVSPQTAALRYADVPLPEGRGDSPHGIAITLATPKFGELESLWGHNGVPHHRSTAGTLLLEPRLCGNVILEFAPGPA